MTISGVSGEVSIADSGKMASGATAALLADALAMLGSFWSCWSFLTGGLGYCGSSPDESLSSLVRVLLASHLLGLPYQLPNSINHQHKSSNMT